MNRYLLIPAAVWLALLGIVAFTVAALPLWSPLAISLTTALHAPSAQHWAGTDQLGRDILSRLVWAARPTILVTAGATALDLLIAVILGLWTSYSGGWADRVVLTIIDLFWTVPFVVFVVLVVSVVGVSIPTLILTIGGINWVTATRVIRAEALTVRRATFVTAALAQGFTKSHVLRLTVLPNLRATVLKLTAYSAIEVLTLETGLSFLGLSLPAPAPTWGGMLAEGLGYYSSSFWIAGNAALAIVLTLGSLQILAGAAERRIGRRV